jgi:phage FluMu gp28-like protein
MFANSASAKESADSLDLTEEQQNKALRILAASPTKFCSEILHFTPFPYQIKLLEDPSKLIIACAARRTGKSLVIGNKALWFAFSHPGTSTLIVAATQRQSILMFDKLLDYVQSSPLLEESVVRKTRTLISFTNGSQITALPCGKNGRTIRGMNAHLTIVDEASFVPDDVILSVMMPMLATTDGTVIMISTPWDKSSFFYQAFNTPIWSKYKFRTSENPLVRKEFLEQQREMLGEKRFRQEYMAEFVDDESTYFPMNLLRPCIHVCSVKSGNEVCSFCYYSRQRKLPRGNLIAGYDPGGMTDPAAMVVVEKIQDAGGKSKFRVVLTKTFLRGNKKDGHQADIYTQFNVEIADLHKLSPFSRLVMDSTGIGGPIAGHCRELGLPVEEVIMSKPNQEKLFSNLRILIEEKRVELSDDLDLLSSLNCIVAERGRFGGYSFSHPSGTKDDLAYALGLAVWKGSESRDVAIIRY